jgi:magnesium chelatase subunit H
VEYGLTDIQEYYANTGGLKKAAEQQRGKKVNASFVESFSKDTTPRSLEDLLRMEYRTKLLNPKWADAMANQGSGGAYEISQRMTALIGWGGTANFTDAWVYDQAADTYALDPEMAKKLRDANPEAFRNIVGRMLEANGRGFWQPDIEKLQQLRELYDLTDEEIEGVAV